MQCIAYAEIGIRSAAVSICTLTILSVTAVCTPEVLQDCSRANAYSFVRIAVVTVIVAVIITVIIQVSCSAAITGSVAVASVRRADASVCLAGFRV